MHFLEEVKFIKRNIILSLILVCLLSIFNIEDAIAQSQAIVTSEISNSHNNEDMNAKHSQLKTALTNETTENVKKLLNQYNTENFNINEIYGCSTLLEFAIQSMIKSPQPFTAAIDKAKILIDSGADANKQTCYFSPLGIAGTLTVQARLMERDINNEIDKKINTGTGDCNLFIDGIPVSKPCKDITADERLQMKTDLKNAFDTLRNKASPYIVQMLTLLVDNGAKVNDVNFESMSALYLIARNTYQGESLEPMKYILEKGANPNIQDNQGNTALFMANFVNNQDAIKLLIDFGADTSIRNKDGLLYNEIKKDKRFGRY